MMDPVLRHFGVSSPPELPPVIYDSPAEVAGRIAQLSKIVVSAAQQQDKVAIRILHDAAIELARAAVAVIEQLRMEVESFRVAYVGGVFEAGELIIEPLRAEITRTAPLAIVSAPLESPVIGATRMARALTAR
jgi:N-acetylglucosamine kinase-like BadF-type ATPase